MDGTTVCHSEKSQKEKQEYPKISLKCRYIEIKYGNIQKSLETNLCTTELWLSGGRGKEEDQWTLVMGCKSESYHTTQWY